MALEPFISIKYNYVLSIQNLYASQLMWKSIIKFKIKNIQIIRGARRCAPTDQKLWYQLFFGNS